jgi:hypothetical protein
VTHPDYPGGIEKVDECSLQPEAGAIVLEHAALPQHGIVLWQFTPAALGDVLKSP